VAKLRTTGDFLSDGEGEELLSCGDSVAVSVYAGGGIPWGGGGGTSEIVSGGESRRWRGLHLGWPRRWCFLKFILDQMQRLNLLWPEFDWVDLLRIDLDRFEAHSIRHCGHHLCRFDLRDLGAGPGRTLRAGVAGVWLGGNKERHGQDDSGNT